MMHWPGNGPLRVCLGHKAHGKSVGEAMGFQPVFTDLEGNNADARPHIAEHAAAVQTLVHVHELLEAGYSPHEVVALIVVFVKDKSIQEQLSKVKEG